MNERERRDFNAGLAEEVDAWLRGDTSRRSFLTKMVLMGGAAALPGFGMTALNSPAWAEAVDLSKLDLADPSTPLGKAQAEALGGGADDCLAGAQPALEQRLRALGGGDGDLVLSGIDQLDPAAPAA